MSKGSEYDFIGLYTAIIADCSMYFPDDREDWGRDLVTLRRLSSTRGQPSFTIDLPALGKVLDRSLDQGLLTLNGLNLSGPRHPGSKIPRLFWGLWKRLFDDSGCLKVDIDPNVVLFLRTLLYVGKNLEWECAPRYLFEATKEFYDVEDEIPPPSHYWDEGVDCTNSSRDVSITGALDRYRREDLFSEENGQLARVLDTVQRESDRISADLGYIDVSEISFRHGPGAVSDLPNSKYKYDFATWSDQLDVLVPYDQYGTTLTGLVGLDPLHGTEVSFEERASRLMAVPKTQKGPRLIAAEPTANQWVQHGVQDFLHRRVAASEFLSLSLDLEDQVPSQEMARLGSKSRGFATIDLKSASDRVSCWLVERVFRVNPPLLALFRACRTRYVSNEIDSKQPSLHKLRKFSTQGSALTFPVQSLIFLAVCAGVGRYLHPTWSTRRIYRSVRVFGDDLIVPNSWEPLVERVLHALWLKVNQTKTFTGLGFRESCGMDAWKGYDVTPPHITMSYQESDARTAASVVACSNNFHMKGFWRAADWLKSTVVSTVRGKQTAVTSRCSGAFGFRSFVPPPIPRRTRWNVALQRDEYWRVSVVAVARRRKQESAAALLQYFTEEPEPHIDYESGVAVAGVPAFRYAWGPITELYSISEA